MRVFFAFGANVQFRYSCQVCHKKVVINQSCVFARLEHSPFTLAQLEYFLNTKKTTNASQKQSNFALVRLVGFGTC